MITASHTLKIAKQPTSSPRRTVNRIRRRTVSMAEITNLCSAPLRKRVDERALRDEQEEDNVKIFRTFGTDGFFIQ
jgi:hypothetical protein